MLLACRDVTSEDLECFVLGHLPAARAAKLDAHARRCAVCRDRLAETREFIATLRAALATLAHERASAHDSAASGAEDRERRTAPRAACHRPATVRYALPAGGVRAVRGRMVDASAEGAGVVLPDAVPVQLRISVQAGPERFCGVVRHCTAVAGGYRVGLSRALAA